MCAQFDLRLSAAELIALLGLVVDGPVPGLAGPRFPGQAVPLLRRIGPGLHATEARWGFARAGAPPARPGARPPHNARAETLGARPLFRPAWEAAAGHPQLGRAAIPASGFTEWDHRAGAPVPVRFAPPAGAPLLLAAVWADGPEGPTAAVLTRPAGEAVREVHDREPVVLAPETLGDWLRGGALADALRHAPSTAVWAATAGPPPRQQALFAPR